ncbi:TatD related DNase [Sulfuriferula nivalis]|uniref:TatD related DNase n=2 Tax=Sulfuriferula nivalis TaxID=2675298 RepID=A0A809SBN8_9PROT|nr:TatD related DNase [Sulfuriferula nivalis]
MIDTHCHLDATEFDADRAEVVARALALGVEQIIVPAVSARNFALVQATCVTYPQCQPALGLHPIFAMQHQPEELNVLRLAVAAERPVAIGEIGLDLFVHDVDMTQQIYYFTEQLKIASEFDLPVLLHTRHANDEIMKQLRRFNIRRGIAHAFNGSVQQAEVFIKQGFKLGFGGAMTYTRATNLRKLAAELPLESIVLETDAPDMSPAWAHGQRNSPEYLPQIAQVLADLRGVSLATILTTTTNNAHAVLKEENV